MAFRAININRNSDKLVEFTLRVNQQAPWREYRVICTAAGARDLSRTYTGAGGNWIDGNHLPLHESAVSPTPITGWCATWWSGFKSLCGCGWLVSKSTYKYGKDSGCCSKSFWKDCCSKKEEAWHCVQTNGPRGQLPPHTDVDNFDNECVVCGSPKPATGGTSNAPGSNQNNNGSSGSVIPGNTGTTNSSGNPAGSNVWYCNETRNGEAAHPSVPNTASVCVVFGAPKSGSAAQATTTHHNVQPHGWNQDNRPADQHNNQPGTASNTSEPSK